MEFETKVNQQSAIRVVNLSKSFGAQRILDGISFDIAAGEALVALGPSGSGKTTLLRIIAGLDTPDAGALFLNGQDARQLSPQKRELGVVFHSSLDNALPKPDLPSGCEELIDFNVSLAL